ncbi:hypothetical protein [Nostoc sp. T09]|nr:hypothetical protein [Nostoc sp. T09]
MLNKLIHQESPNLQSACSLSLSSLAHRPAYNKRDRTLEYLVIVLFASQP